MSTVLDDAGRKLTYSIADGETLAKVVHLLKEF